MKDEIKAIIKEPGQAPREITIKNELKEFQYIVDGYIEPYDFVCDKETVLLICNEEGKMKGLPYNFYLDIYSPEIFVGTVVFVGVDEDEFTDVPVSVEQLEKVIHEDVGAYHCDDCDCWFDDAIEEEVDLEEYFGVGSGFPDHHMARLLRCPFCNSELITTKGEFFG